MSFVKNGPIDQTFLKYIIVGVINTIIGLGSTLAAFHIFGLNYSVAYSIGVAVGVISSFTLNKHFTFKSDKNWKHEAVKFLGVCAIAYLISNFCLIIVVELFAMSHDIGFLCSMVCYTIIGYILNKKVVFKA